VGWVPRARGPTPPYTPTVPGAGAPLVYEVAAWALGEIRRAKSDAKRSLKTEVTHVAIRDTEARLDALRGALGDVKEAGRIVDATLEVATEPSVEVTLAPEDGAS
jgi:valyl-tRNA synthetase